MKKSLIGLLSLSALVIVGMAACTPVTSSSSSSSSSEPSSSEPSSSEESSTPSSSEEEATLLTVAAALEIDSNPPYDFAYLGEKIRIEDVSLTTIIGPNTAFVQEVAGKNVTELTNLELNVVDWGTCDSTRQIVTVEGVLNSVNGHAVLEEAVILEAEKSDEAGTYYWPDITRSHLDNMFSRTWHGYWFSANVQLITVPTTVTAGTAQTFQVVFPGEDTNLENPDNTFPIDVEIPAGITEKEATAINEWLAGAYYVQNQSTGEWEKVQGEPIAAGDYVNMFAMHVFNNYISSFVFNGSSATNTVPAEISNIFTEWYSEASASVMQVLVDYIVDAQDLLCLGSELAYSYVVDDSSWGTSIYGPHAFGGDQFPIYITYYTYEVDELVAELVSKMGNNGYEITDLSETEGAYVGQDNNGHTVVVWVGTTGYVEVYVYGVATFYSGETTAETIEGINTYVDLYPVHVTFDETTGQPAQSEHATMVTPLEDTFKAAGSQVLLSQVQYGGRADDPQSGLTAALILNFLAIYSAADDAAAIAVANTYFNTFLNSSLTPIELDLYGEGEPTLYYFNAENGEAISPGVGYYNKDAGLYMVILEIVVFGDSYQPQPAPAE